MLFLTLIFTLFTIGVSAHYRCFCSNKGSYSTIATINVCRQVNGAKLIISRGRHECKLSNKYSYKGDFIRGCVLRERVDGGSCDEWQSPFSI
ncbi:uncharacterized protein LY79DRAFT_86766 [Colletotrichum navitas]|uniref:Secreted protein n=1 Tax=Colletotrichum navitas TaxID=681940 RepID=A0AAD8UYY4_9PEZI|nr:uncharacterized protein LY79DRAFT_86766 [Colletotrichum navitas]KAK1569403.1 hypothetical protein LY79DRAFT_86766 [Colletotrichum navitas]